MTVRIVVTKTDLRESKNRLVIFDHIKIATIRSAHHIRRARHITYAVLVYHIHRLSRLKRNDVALIPLLGHGLENKKNSTALQDHNASN